MVDTFTFATTVILTSQRKLEVEFLVLVYAVGQAAIYQ
jgi:hypothetical protein